MIDREKMDAAIVASVLEIYPKWKTSKQHVTPTKGERAIYRAGYLAGMRAAAEVAIVAKWTALQASVEINAAADELESEK